MVIEVKNRQKLFVRSIDGYFAGVCQGVAERFGVDPWVIRLLWIISVFAFGTGVFLYVLMALILPREDRLNDYDQDKILGVCRRISMRTGFDLGLVRLLTFMFGLVSLGTACIVYLIAHFVLINRTNRIYS